MARSVMSLKLPIGVATTYNAAVGARKGERSFMGRIVGGGEVARKQGAMAEDLAATYLGRRGLRLLARNVRVRGGEIDLVCREGDEIVFVEVRLRSHAAYGGAAESIDARKQARLILAARHWLARNGEQPCRFDCILLDGLDPKRIRWIRDAFAAD